MSFTCMCHVLKFCQILISFLTCSLYCMFSGKFDFYPCCRNMTYTWSWNRTLFLLTQNLNGMNLLDGSPWFWSNNLTPVLSCIFCPEVWHLQRVVGQHLDPWRGHKTRVTWIYHQLVLPPPPHSIVTLVSQQSLLINLLKSAANKKSVHMLCSS